MKENLLPGVPLVLSPFFDKIFNKDFFSQTEIAIAKSLNEKGYAIIDFPEDNINEVAEEIKTDLYPHYDFSNWREIGYKKNEGLRLPDAHQKYESVKKLALNVNIIKLLSKIYGRQAFPFQTLNFPVGTQQHFHSDEFHFTTNPRGFMCGVWVALENIHKDSGPLEYYPGSHKLPFYDNNQLGLDSRVITPSQKNYDKLWESLIEIYDLKKEVFLPKKGQAVIWAGGLLHGGSKQNNPNLTRWSQVTHYFFENCAYYSPSHSDVFAGSIKFINIKSLFNGENITHKYCNQELSKEFINTCSLKKNDTKIYLPNDFDPKKYLTFNPDVSAAGVDPGQHYIDHGCQEGRKYK